MRKDNYITARLVMILLLNPSKTNLESGSLFLDFFRVWVRIFCVSLIYVPWYVDRRWQSGLTRQQIVMGQL